MVLTELLNSGISDILETAVRFYINNNKGRAFMLKAFDGMIKSMKTRNEYESRGIHIPPFLIASVSSVCNLRCGGCYARANNQCGDKAVENQMNAGDWQRIFNEAAALGIAFILLAGGEPLMRPEIISAASKNKGILFPIFTNGTLIDEAYLDLFDNSRNLIPILSIEGTASETDSRRGNGVAEKIKAAALTLKRKNILYGVSVTVTHDNLSAVTDAVFVDGLRKDGCGIIFYIEYVPAENGTEHLTLTDNDVKALADSVKRLKEDRRNKSLIILSFPGDEASMGGCLAAGRGFFHISPSGAAEPCPFSPFSLVNLKNLSILEVLQSPFFERVRAVSAADASNHNGGCTLFKHKNEVLRALRQ
jgi:MoaA/NifB/PqqE/SkfB family radical SAM enzyme